MMLLLMMIVNCLSSFEFEVFASSSSYSKATSCCNWQATALENKPKVIVDMINLEEQDLELLNKQDPFLCFSIPAVHHASVIRNSRDIGKRQ
jgi:hypothetical protein